MCIKRFFNKGKSLKASREETYSNVDHFYDHTAVQTPPPSWNNIHGFLDSSGFYWAAVDMRSWGIRVQDIVVKCSTKKKAEYWIDLMQKSAKVIDTIKCRDGHKSGSEINTNFIFNCADGYNKNFNISGGSDFYLEDLN